MPIDTAEHPSYLIGIPGRVHHTIIKTVFALAELRTGTTAAVHWRWGLMRPSTITSTTWRRAGCTAATPAVATLAVAGAAAATVAVPRLL